MAHRRLPRFVLEYLEGGADGEACLARNLEALAEWRFTHRSLVDVSHRDISTVLFDRRMAMPVAIAPTGLNGIMWAQADLRLAQAAAEAGIPFAQSTMSNERMERVAQVPGLRYWWQLYVFGPPEVRENLIDAGRAGRMRGADRHDRRADLRQPRMGEAPAVEPDAAVLDRPARSAAPSALADRARPDARSAAFRERDPIRAQGASRAAAKRALDSLADGSRPVVGHGLAHPRRWPRKLIIKGLLSVRDIERAAEIGADAVAISNHGGRQLDWAVAPIDLLPEARRAVGRRIALIVDGGFRRGTDILKALMLGADAVFVGRAALYGVAAAGREGVKRALDILREEIDRDMGLLGVPKVADLDRKLLVQVGGREVRPGDSF